MSKSGEGDDAKVQRLQREAHEASQRNWDKTNAKAKKEEEALKTEMAPAALVIGDKKLLGFLAELAETEADKANRHYASDGYRHNITAAAWLQLGIAARLLSKT